MERLPNEGYSSLVRKFEKRSSFSHRVLIVDLHVTVVKVLRHLTDVLKLFSTRTLPAFPCCSCLRISSSWICGDDCWPVSESGTENMLASDSSSESPRPWRFFVADKDSIRCFGSAHQNTQLLDGFLARTELLALAGVESLVLVGQKRNWRKTKSSFVVLRHLFYIFPSELTGTVSLSVHWKLTSSRFLWALLGR